ncbi:carbohydrate ABC transporter permease [Paenibacillus gansuensis]|uniref:Carbohydrate ABC transporter permease n=1 Tax=Paenibacillus gansuensis TaxID=306542 RepID=A0ABW5PAP5_9BACL
MYYKSRGYRIFSLFNHIFLFALALLCIIPLIHIFAVSLSGKSAAMANLVGLWPVDFTFDAYFKTIGNSNFTTSLWISAKRTVIATFFSMLVVILTAYPLSKDDSFFRGRTVLVWFFVFTMLFNGGLIPNYILVQKLGLINSLWALIIPGLLSAWNVVLLLNFFRNVPKELEEAALIDGAGHLVTLLRVYLPVSLPAIATLSLFTMVGNWNSWFDGLIYMTEMERYPLATFLQSIVVEQDFTRVQINPEDLENLSERTVKSAQIFIGALPILLVYPFLQRFFVKGIVLGAVKE